MKRLVLTGLGNEVDLNTGRTVFTAIFNGHVRIEITEEAAQVLTQSIYGESGGGGGVVELETVSIAPRNGTMHEPTMSAVIEETSGSIYEEDTGVEQV